MKTDRIEFRQLQALHAVLETRSMTAAARMLGISQPAVSSLIRRLEQETGLSLFVRQAGLLQPTADAIALIDSVGRAVSGFEAVATAVENLRTGAGGQLLIAAQPLVSLSILPELISRFRSQRPDVTVRLRTASSIDVQRLLAGRLYDLGIAEMPPGPGAMRIASFRIPCVCILPKGHRLASEAVITPRHLDGEPFIASFPERPVHHDIGSAFMDAGSEWNIVCEADLFAVTCGLVAGGVGVSIVDPFTAAAGGDGVEMRPFAPEISYEFALYRPKDRPLSRAAEAFAGLLTETLQT